MAKFDVSEDVLIAAAAAKIADSCLRDTGFVARLVTAAVSVLSSPQQLRDSFDAGIKKALETRLTAAQTQIAAIPVDLARWQRMALEEEGRWASKLRDAGQQIVNDAKARMRRTMREAIGDLLKDRVDEVLLKLLDVKG